MGEPLLAIEDLEVSFFTRRGEVKAVNGVTLSVREGRTLGLVGESGCGKSVTALAVMRLLPIPPGRILGGEIRFRGEVLSRRSSEEMRKIRGKEIAMIFQDPMTSLDPVFTVGNQIMEGIRLHEGVSRREARARAIELLDLVGIPAPDRRIDDYPGQMSGGMRQRVMIAMAIACHPALLIADEPTTALDVTIQAQILDLLRQLQERFGMGILLVTHDLGVVAGNADEVAVMYAGRIVEQAPVDLLFERPRHPYTEGLFASLPRLPEGGEKPPPLEPIPGIVPDLLELPAGCPFAERCRHRFERCQVEDPVLCEVEPGHLVRCFLHEGPATGGEGGRR